MSRRNEEPPYPSTEQELEIYCNRFIAALKGNLGERLVCVLLNGSWARGEANPPHSDVDLTVIIDKIDEDTSNALCRTWTEVNMGCANVVDLVEIKAKPRELIAMLCDKSKLLFGHNPFQPSKEDFACNVSSTASSIGLYARTVDYYPWEGLDRKVKDMKYVMTSKYNLKWLLKNLIAFRIGTFPENNEELITMLKDKPERELYNWSITFTNEDYIRRYRDLARTLSIFVHNWLEEVSDYVK